MAKAQFLLKTLFILSLFVFAGSVAVAQDTLSIERAIEIALQNNPDVQLSRLNIRRAESVTAGLTFFPFLPEVDFGYSTDALTNGDGFRITDFSLTQQFEIGGKNSLRRAVAEANIGRARAEALAFEREIIAETRRTYARLAISQRRIVLQHQLADFAELLREFSEESFKVGRISEFDYSLSRIDAATRISELNRTQSGILQAETTLNRLLGQSGNGRIATIIDTIVSGNPVAGDTLVRRAFATRNDLRALEQEIVAAQKGIELARLSYLPNIRAGLTYGTDNSILPDFKTTHLLGFTVGIPLPLRIDGLYNYGQGEILQRAVELDIATLRLDALRRRIEGEVTLAVEKYERARLSLAMFNSVLPEFQKNLDVLDKAYRVGQIDLNTLLTQKDRLARSEQSYFDVLEDYLIAKSEFYQALGFIPN